MLEGPGVLEGREDHGVEAVMRKKEAAFPKHVRETRQSMGGERETAPPGTQLPVRGGVRTVRQCDRGENSVF